MATTDPRRRRPDPRRPRAIGITRTLPLRSSWSGGLHLYIPFAEAVNTFAQVVNLAVAIKEYPEAQGFRLKTGQLEIFPNVKAYGKCH